jgi:hypothetical protein
MKSKVICILNKESIALIEKYFNLSDYDIVCFDQVSGQKVTDLDYDVIDMSVNFPSQFGFISGSSFIQITSYYKNKNVFNSFLNNYSEVNFTFENVYVRMFCLNSKIKSTILFSGTIHDERYSLKMIRNFSFRNSKLHFLYFFKKFRKFKLGALLPGLNGSALTSKYVVIDEYSKKVLVNRIPSKIKVDVEKGINTISNSNHVNGKYSDNVIFNCSAWLHHGKSKEHFKQIDDIKIIYNLLLNKNKLLIKLHPRNKIEDFNILIEMGLNVNYFVWDEILSLNNIYFSNLSTSILELDQAGYTSYALMISFEEKLYANTLISYEKIKVINNSEVLSKLINEN